MKSRIMINSILAMILVFPALLSAGKKGDNYYSWIHRTRVRSAPDLKMKGIAFLNEGERVVLTGDVSINKIKITLRGKIYYSPFYKVRLIEREKWDGKDVVRTGWVYGGTLKKLPQKVIQYDTIINEIENLHKSLSEKNVKENKKFDIVKISRSSVKTGKVIYNKFSMRNECLGSDEYLVYYNNGCIEYNGMVGYTYLIHKFPEIMKGIKPGTEKSEIKKILGTPMRENKNILTYAINAMSYETGRNENFECVYLYFKNNKLFAVYLTAVVQPC